MKICFLLLLTFSLNTLAQAKVCEVYGISDSPQKLNCTLAGNKLNLTCDRETGTYLIDSDLVEVAYHEEVEDGPVPLLFKTVEAKLKILIHSNKRIEAEYTQHSGITTGFCHL